MKGNLRKILAHSLAEILKQGVGLIEKIDDESYSQNVTETCKNGGTVGGHFRHCLEFVNCFLGGIDAGSIDYSLRERNQKIETDRNFAIEELKKTIEILENSKSVEKIISKVLLVKPETAAAEDFWCESSIERELEFLNSHTIHHFALIGFKLHTRGFVLPEEFGVAPSTLKYWSERQTSAAG